MKFYSIEYILNHLFIRQIKKYLIQILQQQFIQKFQQFAEKKTLGVFNELTQQYDHVTYKEIQEISSNIGSSLVLDESIRSVTDEQNNIIKPVGIYLANRREWIYIALGCLLYGFTTCPFYDNMGPQNMKYIFDLTQTRYKVFYFSICFVEEKTAKQLITINLPYLKTIVIVGEIEESVLDKLKTQYRVQTWEGFNKFGEECPQKYPKIELSSILTLIFTSGTTAKPKATIFNYSNFGSMMMTSKIQDYPISLKEDDVYLLYAPLPHISQRLIHLQALLEGAELNFSSGDISCIVRDIARCKPTCFFTLPAILNRFYEGILQKIAGLPEDIKLKFENSLRLKQDYIKQTGKMTHEQLDQAFANIKVLMGGRQRLMMTGAAPISAKVVDFLKATFCCQIMEAYGQTESCGGSFLTDFLDVSSGHVGGPVISQEFKLVSVPELNYFTDGRVQGKVQGEICLRGLSVMTGYFNNPEYTAKVFDQEGWLYTGDIGEIIDGTVRIIDRKDNLFKLSQGEYISPEKIQNIYQSMKGIREVIVYGDCLKKATVGIVVAEPQLLEQLDQQLGLNGDQQQIYTNKIIRDEVLKLLNEHGKKENLLDYEQIKNIYLEPSAFSQLGLLTETQKIQRGKAKLHYEKIIQELYNEMN